MTIDTNTLRMAARAHADLEQDVTSQLLTDAADTINAQAAQLSAYPADWRKDSSLETWFPLTAEQLKAQTTEIEHLLAALHTALPFVEDAENHGTYKREFVRAALKQISAALAQEQS